MYHNPQNRNLITTFEIYLPSQIISLTAYCYINVRRNRRGNQECIIQMHWQHWARKTQDEDKIKEKKNNKQSKIKQTNKNRTKTTEKITNTDPTKNPCWLQVLVMGKQFPPQTPLKYKSSCWFLHKTRYIRVHYVSGYLVDFICYTITRALILGRSSIILCVIYT